MRLTSRRFVLAWIGSLLWPVVGLAAEPPGDPQEIFRAAVAALFDARPAESARLFDVLVEARPEREPDLWQRGLALYYADRWADGRRQFEVHRTVNPADVENVAWHFACVARLEGAAAARLALLPVGPDRRVPMREIAAFYAGTAAATDVLAAAEEGPEPARRNQLCYAHLYLGLHAEACGDTETARRHMQAAAGPFSMDHFMGRIARLHVRLRGWADEDEPAR